jgi:hypothetical protein
MEDFVDILGQVVGKEDQNPAYSLTYEKVLIVAKKI